MSVCIHHDGALGDVLLSLPLLKTISCRCGTPDWIGQGGVGELLHALGIVGATFDAGESRFAQWYVPQPGPDALNLLASYDAVYLFTSQPASDLARNIRAAVRNMRVIATLPTAGSRTHVAQYREQQLPQDLRSIDRDGIRVPLLLREQALVSIKRAGRPGGQGCRLIVIHPGSGGKAKCWPLERYLELARRLSERSGDFVLFLTGPAETGGTVERIEQCVQGSAGLGLAAGMLLPVVAGILAECDLYIGNDSGITHLAAVVDASVLALFGPTDPVLWAPRGARVQVISAGALADLSVDEVDAAARALLRSADVCGKGFGA